MAKNITHIQKEYAKQVKRIKQFVSRAEKRGYMFSESVLPDRPKKITQASVNRLAKLTPEKLYKKAEYGGEATYGEIVSGVQGVKAERKARGIKSAQKRKNRVKAKFQPTRDFLQSESSKKAEDEAKIAEIEGMSLYEKIQLLESIGYHLPENFVPDEPLPEEANEFVPPVNISEDETFFDLTVISGFREHVSQFNERAKNLLLSWLDKILATNDMHDVAIMLQQGAENGYIVTWQIVYSDVKLHNYMSNMLNYLPEAGPLYKQQIMEAMEEEEGFSIPE